MSNPQQEGPRTGNEMSRRRGTTKSKPEGVTRASCGSGGAKLTVDNGWVVEDTFDETEPVPAWVRGSFTIRHTPEQIAEFKEMKNVEYWRQKVVGEQERQVDDPSSEVEEGDEMNRSMHLDPDTTGSVITLSSGPSSLHEDQGQAKKGGSNHHQPRKAEGMIRKRVFKGTYRYLVRWEGMPDSKSTWEGEDKLRSLGYGGLLEEFNKGWVPTKRQRRYIKDKLKRDGNAAGGTLVLDVAVGRERDKEVVGGDAADPSSGQ